MGLSGSKKKDGNILIVGLDNSGKTSIINYFKPNDCKSSVIVPTVGFNVEKFNANSLNFTTFDMSGQGRYRNLWETYYKEVDAVIFVIDSSDKIRLVVAKEELQSLLTHRDVKNKNIPILIYANKSDMKDSLSSNKIISEFELPSVTNKSWHVVQSNALNGDGLKEGMDWLSSQLKSIWQQNK